MTTAVNIQSCVVLGLRTHINTNTQRVEETAAILPSVYLLLSQFLLAALWVARADMDPFPILLAARRKPDQTYE